MKAISVRQPFASLIVNGEKTIEMRAWKTDYRGPLLICAGMNRGVPASAFRTRKEREEFDEKFPRGVAVGIADLVDIREFRQRDTKHTGEPFYCKIIRERFNSRVFADYDGFSWVFANAKRIEPFKVKGQLRLFDVNVPKRVLRVLIEKDLLEKVKGAN